MIYKDTHWWYCHPSVTPVLCSWTRLMSLSSWNTLLFFPGLAPILLVHNIIIIMIIIKCTSFCYSIQQKWQTLIGYRYEIIECLFHFFRSWYKEAGISFLLDFRSSRAAVVTHVVGLIQAFQVCAKSHLNWHNSTFHIQGCCQSFVIEVWKTLCCKLVHHEWLTDCKSDKTNKIFNFLVCI